MTGPRSGWYRDPVSRYKTRWWDGNNWRGWVDGNGSVERDPLPNAMYANVVVSETPTQARWRHRRRRVAITAKVAVTVAFIGAIVLGGFALLVNESDEEGERIAKQFVREMDSWVLPDTVAQGDRPDDVSGGTFGASGPRARRYFVPQRGATGREAAIDLIEALRAQGYDDLEPLRGSSSFGSCGTQRQQCSLDIFVFRDSIEVTLDS